MPAATRGTIDAILAFQLTVAWAGESRESTGRLGWWNTDLVDATGGGDLLARLLPRTHAWASLEGAREAARRVDEQARRALADPDRARTIFFLGFDLDEALRERLAELKRTGGLPAEALAFPLDLTAPFSTESLRVALALPGANGAPDHEVVPGGRRLKGAMPADPALAVRSLAAALAPFPERYPAPLYRVTG